MMRSRILLLCCFLLPGFLVSQPAAYHAGGMFLEQFGDPLSSPIAKVTIVTYSDLDAPGPDSLELCWGDGLCELIPRVNGPGAPPPGEVLENGILRSAYQAMHTYPTNGVYQLSLNECCWTPESRTIPDSGQTPFILMTDYELPNPLLLGSNDTPIYLFPPIETAQTVGQPFQSNFNLYDSDFDSVAFSFVPVIQADGYLFPEEIAPGPDNQFDIDPLTGDITWDSPQEAGRYHLALSTREYRGGVPISRSYLAIEIEVQETTATEEAFSPSAWRLAPNPARGQTVITGLPAGFSGPVRLYDAQGRTLRLLHATGNRPTLDLSGLPAGLYAVRVGDGQTKRLVVR